ncbi:tetratricopeptide repeat protein [bacterium]|nr:tetratricopeptide repeat protein [bacterium]
MSLRRTASLMLAVVLLMSAFVVAAPMPAGAQTDPVASRQAKLEADLRSLREEREKLQERIAELLGPEEQAEKKNLRAKVEVINRQIRVKELELRNVTKGRLARGQDAIRASYTSELRALEAQKADKRRETIEKFEKILSETQDRNLSPEVMFRLAQLYFEESYYQYTLQMDEYDRLAESGQDPGLPPDPTYNRSIQLYRQIVEEHPNYARADAAMYLLAFCYMENGDVDVALKTYQEMIGRYPSSSYIPEAHVRMGEIYFERGEFNRSAYDQAIYHYKQVDTRSKFYDKALYKLGWTYYKMATIYNPEPLDQAVDYFTQVLDYYEMRPTKRIGAGDDLRKESIDYIAIAFTDMRDGLGYAKNYFATKGNPKWTKDILEKMVEVYFAADNYEEGRATAFHYLEQYPYDVKDPSIALLVVDSYDKEGDYPNVVEWTEKIAEDYGPDSAWRKNVRGTREQINGADKIVMNSLYANATFNHDMALKAGIAGDEKEANARFNRAIRSYDLYTTMFPEAPRRKQSLFNLGEAYYDTGRFVEAADFYQKVLDFPAKQDCKGCIDAEFNKVKALQKAVEEEGLPNEDIRKLVEAEGGSQIKVEDVGTLSLKRMPLTPVAQSYVDSLVAYAPKASKGSDVDPASAATAPAPFLVAAGRVYFWYGHMDQANGLFQKVASEYGGSPAESNARFYLVEGAKLGGEIRDVVDFLKNNPAQQAELRDEETKLKNNAIWVIASRARDESKGNEAIAAYMEAYDADPTSDDAPSALHNIAVIYEQDLHNITRANEYLVRVAQEFPTYEYSAEDLFHAAYNFEKIGRFEDAQKTYYQYSQTYSNMPKAEDALFNATNLAIKDFRFSEAITLAREYSERYPDAKDAGEPLFQIARINERLNNLPDAQATYNEYLDRFTNDPEHIIEAHTKLGVWAYKAGDSTEASRHLNLAVAIYDQYAGAVEGAKGYAAEAKFYQADPIWNQYTAQKFTGDITQDATILQEKAATFKQLQGLYEEVIGYADFEWFTAGLHMIGMINREFSESLFTAPVPDGLTPEQEDEYIIKLEDIAFPIKEKAAEAFQKNVDKGRAERVRNKWIDQSWAMAKLYDPKIEEDKFEEPVFDGQVAFAGAKFALEPKAKAAPAVEEVPDLPAEPAAEPAAEPSTEPAETEEPAADAPGDAVEEG